MWNVPTEEQLASIPRLYEAEHITLRDKIIHFHFFIGGCDWYIAEFDSKDTFFGFTILNGDLQNAEWGYVSFKELKDIKIGGYLEVDHNLYWDPRPSREVKLICKAHGWGVGEIHQNNNRKGEINGIHT